MFQRQVTILAVAGGLVFVLDDGLCVPSEQVFTCGIAPSFLNDDDDDDEVYLSVTKEWSWLSHCRVYDLVAGAWTMNKELDFGIEAPDLVVCGEIVFWGMKLGLTVIAFDRKTKST
ncbi:hypothetical protein B296_00056315 [Ensete ventricosum]|uniref:DUF1618 domain-containing protein n=1 Tax=Ensete ventricosum TaxID=4639 RepID=A0A426WY99_ENSVE|nr:hypothetical protein B296_00056315 [Ensete ventricosum]